MIKVLHITSETVWRGGEKQLAMLVRGLNGLDIECHVATQPGAMIAAALSASARVVPMTMANDLDVVAITRIVRYCQKERIDIVHAHTARAHALALAARRFLSSTRLIVHRRVQASSELNWMSRAKYLSNNIDCYVAISQAIAGDLSRLGVPPHKISVIPSAIDEIPFRNLTPATRLQMRSELEVPPGVPLIVAVSHLCPRKGLETLLRALALLKARNLPFRACIAGLGSDLDRLVALSRALALDSAVTFLGFRSDVPQILQAADVFVHPSEWEGLGNAVLESAYSGCAIVASRVGGLPEIIADGETGLLVEPRDVDGFANAIAALCTSLTLRKALSERGRERITQTFSLDGLISLHSKLYRRLSEGSESRRGRQRNDGNIVMAIGDQRA